jgi:hypothetical protein
MKYIAPWNHSSWTVYSQNSLFQSGKLTSACMVTLSRLATTGAMRGGKL